MFPDSLPSIDLHGYDRESARIAVKDFLTDMCMLKEKKCVIVHGIGSGILRKEITNYLKTDKRVAAFSLSFMNPGCTIVELNSFLDKTRKK